MSKFLTHHNLQGSQTEIAFIAVAIKFLTHHNLQGSQTMSSAWKYYDLFLTHHNLQGSQTPSATELVAILFLTHHNLQGSQTSNLHFGHHRTHLSHNSEIMITPYFTIKHRSLSIIYTFSSPITSPSVISIRTKLILL